MKKSNFRICGMNPLFFAIFFAIILIALYGGFFPKVTIFSNDSGKYVATELVGTIGFLMAVGGFLYWLGQTLPVVGSYLGGAVLLPLMGGAVLNYLGVIPGTLQNGVKVLMSGGLQNVYIALLLVGSIFVIDRKVILGAVARYMPTIIGSQFFALAFAGIGGLITGFGFVNGIFNVAAPCMSGGSSGALTTIPSLYSSITGVDMSGMSGIFLCYVTISNIIAVILAATVGKITENMPGMNGHGAIAKAQVNMTTGDGEERPGTSPDYVALGSGILISLAFYLLGSIAGGLPVLNKLPGIAWTIIFVIIIKCAHVLPQQIEDNAVYAMNFALKALFPMIVFAIGINSLDFGSMMEYFSISALITIFLGTLGALVGAMLLAKVSGLFPYEAGVTAGLCCCNIGGSGDLAVLQAADRMNLLAFASISTRIGGALMVIWISFLYPLLH